MTNKRQPILSNKLAGKETSLKQVWRQKSESRPVQVSKKTDYIRSHVEHFVLCLRDAYGFKDPMEVVNKVTQRLERLFPNIAIEKVFKWFYGNSLGWCTDISEDIVRLQEVDDLHLDSANWYDSSKIFGGRLSKFLQKFFRRQSRHTQPTSEWKRRKQAFAKAQTFLMFKKGSPQVSEDLINEADRKHRIAMSNTKKAISHLSTLDKYMDTPMTQESNHDSDGWPETIVSSDWGVEAENAEPSIEDASLQIEIEEQCRFIVNAIFKPGSFDRVLRKETLDKSGPDFPSTRAHSDPETSRFHGGAVNLIREHFVPQVGELISMSYHPKLGVQTHYAISYPNAVDSIVSDLKNNNFIAEPVYLREPLKVRTITKGPSTPYWFFKPIQKWLWSSLQRHPIFELIGTPITSEILNKMLPTANPLGKWLSGDYSAATDNLVRWLSEIIWVQICNRSGIPSELMDLGLRGLTDHTLRYDDELVLQQNGQLMGSPLSFPILCIANAAICLLAFDKPRRRMNAALKVNGDDCVMCYTDEERLRWTKYANFIGMTPSPGKCYFAPDWLQMNSELFLLHKGSFRHINFINFSLASPYLSKGGQERTIESLSQTMQSFCIGKSSKQIDIWIRRMAPYLKAKVPKLISWYMPQCLGGLGLMTTELSGKIFTSQQIRVASLFYKSAVEGKELPYKISSVRGGKADYQNLKIHNAITKKAIFDADIKPVKSYWSERFFKDKTEEEKFTPLLWERLLTGGEILIDEFATKPVLSKKVERVFYKKSKKVEPIELKVLLSFRGYDISILDEALKSDYEPKNVFLDVLARFMGID